MLRENRLTGEAGAGALKAAAGAGAGLEGAGAASLREDLDRSSCPDRGPFVFSDFDRPKEISNKWAMRINKEFFAQVKTEKELNLPVTGFMDPTKVPSHPTPPNRTQFWRLRSRRLLKSFGDLDPWIDVQQFL